MQLEQLTFQGEFILHLDDHPSKMTLNILLSDYWTTGLVAWTSDL